LAFGVIRHKSPSVGEIGEHPQQVIPYQGWCWFCLAEKKRKKREKKKMMKKRKKKRKYMSENKKQNKKINKRERESRK